jgi:hypothetical protein
MIKVGPTATPTHVNVRVLDKSMELCVWRPPRRVERYIAWRNPLRKPSSDPPGGSDSAEIDANGEPTEKRTQQRKDMRGGAHRISALRRFGVAPQLLLRFQLGAAWLMLLLALTTIPAIKENIEARPHGERSTYLASTLGWGLASVSKHEIRLQNWLSIVQIFLVLGFLVWARRAMRYYRWQTDEGCLTAADCARPRSNTGPSLTHPPLPV